MGILCGFGQRAEENGAGGFGAEENRAKAGCPSDDGGDCPAGLQSGCVEHPFAGEAAHQGDAHHAAGAD